MVKIAVDGGDNAPGIVLEAVEKQSMILKI